MDIEHWLGLPIAYLSMLRSGTYGAALAVAFFIILKGARAHMGGKGPRSGLALMFTRNVWLTRSTFVDFCLTATYSVASKIPATMLLTGIIHLMMPGLIPDLAQQALAIEWSGKFLFQGALLGITMLVFNDLANYWVHRLLHQLPWLRRIHTLHHSAEQLTLLTTHRIHPIEPLLLAIGRGLALTPVLMVAQTIFSDQLASTLLAALCISSPLYHLTLHLQHCHISIRYPRLLRYFLMSPHVHQIHHSSAPEHRHKNYAIVFSFWDRMFGTYLDDLPLKQVLRFGIPGRSLTFRQALTLYIQPIPFLMESFAIMRKKHAALRRQSPQ